VHLDDAWSRAPTAQLPEMGKAVYNVLKKEFKYVYVAEVNT